MGSLISRSQYDNLVRRYPTWMARVWPKLVLRWYVYGPSFDDRFHRRFTILLSRENFS